MGKTFRRNDRWKRDHRDKNFQKSKKLKHAQHEKHEHKPHDVSPTDNIPDDDNDIDY